MITLQLIDYQPFKQKYTGKKGKKIKFYQDYLTNRYSIIPSISLQNDLILT